MLFFKLISAYEQAILIPEHKKEIEDKLEETNKLLEAHAEKLDFNQQERKDYSEAFGKLTYK